MQASSLKSWANFQLHGVAYDVLLDFATLLKRHMNFHALPVRTLLVTAHGRILTRVRFEKYREVVVWFYVAGAAGLLVHAFVCLLAPFGILSDTVAF